MCGLFTLSLEARGFKTATEVSGFENRSVRVFAKVPHIPLCEIYD
jgi:hypothetical protein